MYEQFHFQIEFTADGKSYRGSVHPSDKFAPQGNPVSFNVVIHKVSFGYLSFHMGKWQVDEERPDLMVQRIGEEIEKFYAHNSLAGRYK